VQLRTASAAALVAAVAALVGTTLPASAQHGASGANPGRAHRETTSTAVPATPANAVKAVVVKSWSDCSSGSVVWDALNAHWSSYGSTPISIDYSDPNLCGYSFTLADLEASAADVVILDDPAGNGKQFTQAEVDALKSYADEGHGLIGTYLTFVFKGQGIDNSALAPLFGLVKMNNWGGGDDIIAPTYKLRVNKHRGPAKALYRGLPNPYVSSGYNYSQLPGDGVWSRNDLAGARVIAVNANRSAAITVYSRQEAYNAIYIANMPEYRGGAQDQQFLYNAIIYPRKG
jgi:hypothetical protein